MVDRCCPTEVLFSLLLPFSRRLYLIVTLSITKSYDCLMSISWGYGRASLAPWNNSLKSNFLSFLDFHIVLLIYLMSGKSQAPMETNFSHRDNLELSVQESREAELPVLGELKVRN